MAHSTSIKERLYPFQQVDLERLLRLPRCINGNPMGLGKTVETLALIEELHDELNHILIISPKTATIEWWYQIDQWLDEPCLTPHDQGDKLLGLRLDLPKFVCINYDLLARPNYLTKLLKVKWDLIVFDECHKLKNPKAKRTKAAFLLANGNGTKRINLVSGTPMQNTPEDLWPLFHIICSKDFPRPKPFMHRYCATEKKEVKVFNKRTNKVVTRYFNHIVGVKNLEELKQILSTCMIRNEKRDVLKDLPEKQYRTVPIQLGKERAQYNQMEDNLFALLDNGELITAPAVIAQLTRLRQICLDPNLLSSEETKKSSSSSKTQAVLEILDSTDDKVVIFTWFEQYARILARELDAHMIPYVTITGKVPLSERGDANYQFQNDPRTKVCLGTIGAMGESITLTSSSTCIFTDLAWNPKANEQAEDRLYGRLNDLHGALIIDLWCEKTVEDHVHQVVRRKEKWFNEIVVTKSIIESMRQSRDR